MKKLVAVDLLIKKFPLKKQGLNDLSLADEVLEVIFIDKNFVNDIIENVKLK